MRKNRVLFLASALLLAVSSGAIGQGISVFAAQEIEQTEERKGETHGGVISFGNGNASITIKGKEGQSLVGKNFYVYQLFFAENAKGGESINYTFHPKYEEAVKTVVAKGLTESGKPTTAENVTEYMAVDYIQSLNSYKVEGATTPQELEGSYSQFRYFVETLRDELETRKIVGDEVSVTNTQADNSIRIEGLEYGYYDVLLYTADHECGGKLPIHVRLWADEFYAGPKPTRTEVLMGTIRGRNMSIVPILQSIAQAQALFPQNKWEIFVENCAVMVYLGSGPGAKSTHEYISKLLGDMTIDTRDDGRSFGSHGNSNIQNRKSGRTLMTPAEVRRMSRKDCLIFIEGQYPIFDRKAIPFRTKRWMEAEKLAGKNGYRHPVEVVFDEETRSYITVQQKEKIEFLTKEEKEIYRQLAKTDENLHYWEVDADAFLYMNFRRPQPTEEEIEQIFQKAKREKDALRQLQNTEEELPEDIRAMLQQEKPDLSGSVIECIERYQKELSAEQKEILINSLVLGLTEKQVKNMFFQPKERMEKYQKAYLFQNLPFRNSEHNKEEV